MAKKKTAIGDLIKSDMSRRTIGEETELFSGEPDKKPSEKKPPVAPPPAVATPVPAAPVTARATAVPRGIADLTAAIAERANSAGLTDEADLRTFYDFLQNQALRYIRGFDAGRRFRG